jgi:hypothetical protein
MELVINGIVQVATGRELQLYVGRHGIELLVNVDCSILQLRCEDMNLLHHVKCSLANILKEDGNSKKPVLINCTILNVAQVSIYLSIYIYIYINGCVCLCMYDQA